MPREKGIAKKLNAERLADSIAIKAPGEHAPIKPIPLRIVPLLAPFRDKGRLTLRVEAVPQLVRLSRGRNNGNGSWSLTPAEAEHVDYIPPDAAHRPAVLSVRIIGLDQEGTTLAVRNLPVEAASEPVLETAREPVREPREHTTREHTPRDHAPRDHAAPSSSAADTAYLDRLGAELKAARAQLAERETDLANARRAAEAAQQDSRKVLDAAAAERARWERETESRLAAAAAQAAKAAERERDTWNASESARLASVTAQSRDAIARAVADARAEADAAAAATLRSAERRWQAGETERLAAAEARWRDDAAKARTSDAKSADTALTQLRKQLTDAETLLRQRDGELARARTAADQAKTTDAALAQLRTQLSDAEAALRQRDGELTRARTAADQAKATDATLAQLRTQLSDAEAALRQRDDELTRARTEATAARATADQTKTADATLAQLRTQLFDAEAALRQRDSELAALRADTAAASTADTALTARADAAERALAEAREIAAAQGETVARLKDEAATLRTRLADAERAPPPAPAADPKSIDAALSKAKAAWKTEEEARFASAEAKWKSDAAAVVGRVTARAEEAEAALAAAISAPPPVADPPPPVASKSPADKATIDNLRKELSTLRRTLADRDAELDHARAAKASDRRTHSREPLPSMASVGEAMPDIRTARSARAARDDEKPAPKRGHLMRDILIVCAFAGALVFGLPFITPLLPFEMQVTIAETLHSLGLGPPVKIIPSTPGAVAPAAVATDTAPHTVTALRAVNLRKSPSPGAPIVARLKKGDTADAGKTDGKWTLLNVEGVEGWAFTAYLEPAATTP